MPFQNEPIAAMVAGCCSPLQYLEGAAYIAIVLAVLGVPQLLTYYLDQRNRRNERREDLAEDIFDGAGVAADRGAGTGQFVDANPPGANRIEGDPRGGYEDGVGGFWFLARGRAPPDAAR